MYWDGDVPFVTPPDLNGLDGAIVTKTGRSITAAGVPHSGMAPAGAVLLSTRAPIGHIGRIQQPSSFNQGCRALVPTNGYGPRFLAYTLVSARRELEARGQGTTFLELPAGALADIQVPSLDSDAQRMVADYLDRETAQIDAFIAKNEELIALLTERRQGSLEQALNPSGQSNWTRTTMRRLGVISASGVSVNGYSVPAVGDEVGVLKTGSVSKGYFDPIQNKRVSEEDLNRVQTPVRAGTLVVNRANTPQLVGSSGYVEDDHPNLFLSDKLWELRFERADPLFIHYWTHTNAYRGQLQSLSVGASSSMQNLSFSDFLGIAIDLPPLEEQREISIALGQELNAADKAKEVALSAIALANERRSALISAAVTGQIDIKEQA